MSPAVLGSYEPKFALRGSEEAFGPWSTSAQKLLRALKELHGLVKAMTGPLMADTGEGTQTLLTVTTRNQRQQKNNGQVAAWPLYTTERGCIQAQHTPSI